MGRYKECAEVTPENEDKARVFMEYYANNLAHLQRCVRGGSAEYDEDLFNDAFLRAYDAIARRGTDVRDYAGYFLKTYRAAFLDSKRRQTINTTSGREIAEVAASTFDSDKYEATVDALNAEVIDYVRDKYDEVAVSLFEIYVGLSPDISYKRMSAILGIPATKIWPVIGQIKKDLVKRFDTRRHFLLAAVEF